jgi:hypothetical protein
MKRSTIIVMITFWSFIVFFTGCQKSLYTLTNEEMAYSQTDENKITITTMNRTDKSHKEIGYVYAWGSSQEDAIENLKNRVAEIGGDALIQLKITVTRIFIYFIPFDTYTCSGIAIKY